MKNASQPVRPRPMGFVGQETVQERRLASRLTTWVDSVMVAGVLVVLLIIPIHRQSFEVAVVGVLTLFLLWSIKAALQKRMVITWSPLHLVFLLFLGVCLLQLVPLPFAVHHQFNFNPSGEGSPGPLTPWSIITFDKRATTEAVIALTTGIGYLVVVLNVINNQKRLRLIVNWLITIGFAIAILSFLNYFSPSNNPLLGGSWPLGFYFRDLEYPGLLEMILPLPLAMIFAGGVRQDQSVLYGFAAVTIGVAVATAITNASAIVLVLEIVFLALLIARQRRSPTAARGRRFGKMWTAVGVVTIMAGLVAGVLWTAARPVTQMISSDVTRELRGVSALQGNPSDRSHYTRLVIWKTTLHVMADYPLFGVGVGALPTAYKLYDPAPGLREVNAAHNDYLQLLSETGTAGGLLLVFFLIFLTHASQKALLSRTPLGRSVALGASVGCFGILAHSLNDFYLQAFINALVFFLLVALLLIVQRNEQLSAVDRHPVNK